MAYQNPHEIHETSQVTRPYNDQFLKPLYPLVILHSYWKLPILGNHRFNKKNMLHSKVWSYQRLINKWVFVLLLVCSSGCEGRSFHGFKIKNHLQDLMDLIFSTSGPQFCYCIIFLYVCKYVCIHVYLYICTLCTYIYIYTYIYIHIYIYIHVHIYIYTCIYICIGERLATHMY